MGWELAESVMLEVITRGQEFVLVRDILLLIQDALRNRSFRLL